MLIGVIATVTAGCTIARPPELNQPTIALPARHQIRSGQFVFLSDFDLRAEHPLLHELDALNEEIYQELRLPPSDRLVYVFLFNDRAAFESYLTDHYPELPPRRAYFLTWQSPGGPQLRVLSFWGDQIQKDLRHELTHAALHAVLPEVPLWLDEGLAEFFEPPPSWQGVNYRHLRDLDAGEPWRPNLLRLEKLTQVREMTAADYREAWAWTHFLLRGSPTGRGLLLRYLTDLRTNSSPEPLSGRLQAAVPNAEEKVQEYLVKLSLSTRAIPAEATPK